MHWGFFLGGRLLLFSIVISSFCMYLFSEHSRHWFFKGKLVIDGKEHPRSLFDMIMATQDDSNDNNVIKFNDNSRHVVYIYIDWLKIFFYLCFLTIKLLILANFTLDS